MTATETKPQASSRKRTAAKAGPEPPTLIELAESDLGRLEKEGKSATTVFGDRMERSRAVEERGWIEKAPVPVKPKAKAKA